MLLMNNWALRRKGCLHLEEKFLSILSCIENVSIVMILQLKKDTTKDM